MKKKFLLITLIMCLFGGVNLKTLNAQKTVTIPRDSTNNLSQYGNYGGPFDVYTTAINSSQSIYTSAEIGRGKGKIEKIAFKVDVADNSSNYNRSIIVWLKNTPETNFGKNNKETLDTITDADKVYTGSYSINTSGWIEIDINDFDYDGTNLLVSVCDTTRAKGSGSTKFNMYKSIKVDTTYNYWYKTLYKTGARPDGTTKFSGVDYTASLQLTFASNSGGGDDPAAEPDAPTLVGPTGNDVFNPFFNFTLGDNTTHYQISIGTAEGTGDPNYTPVTGWVEKGGTEVSYHISDFDYTLTYNPSTVYYWKVVARNGEGDDDPTAESEASFTTRNVTAAPGELTNVSPENNAQDLINPKLEWTFGENTEEQQLLIDGVVKVDWTNIGTKTSDSYQTSGLTAGSHTWQVNTRNGEGTTTGTEYSFTVASLPDNVTPISPANGATNVSSKTIKWQFADNTTEYRFLYGEAEDQLAYCGYGTKDQWLEVTTDEVELEAPYFELGKTYYWAVDVMNDNGQRTIHQGGEKAMVFSFTTSSISPATLEEPANNATISVPTATLKWKYVGDAAEYQVCYGTDQNNLTAQGWTDRSPGENITDTYGKPEDTFTIENLAPATTYYWKVQVRKDGVEPIDSEVWSFTTIGLPEAVTDMQPSDEASLSANPNLSWAFGANTNEYQVLLGTTNPPTDVVVDWTSTLATSYQTSVDANIEYYWQVNVRNAFGETTGSVYSFTKAGVPDDVTPIDPEDGATDVSTIVTLTWRFAPNTTHYRVLVDIGNGGFEYPNNNTEWIEVTGETASFSTDGLGLEANKTYSWAVDVKNNIGTRTIYVYGDGIKAASYSFTTTDKTEAKYTAPLNDEIMKTTTATLQWKYGAGNIVNYYKVYFGKDENNLVAVTEWKERGMTSSDTYTTEVLDNDTRYYWRVDVKYGEDGDVLKGDTATFVSLLTVPENLSCITNVYPDTPFDISWDATAKATGYNIYVDGIMLSENISGTTYSHTMTNSDYNMAEGHDIQVTAVYAGLGESQKTEAANVKVTGYGGIRGLVQNINGENIANATITLVGADEFGNEKTITGITTNNVGYFESNEVLVGTYTLKVNANNIYDEFVDDREISIEYGKTLNFGTIVLKSQYLYTVTLGNVKASSVMILLSDGSQINIGDDFDVILEYEGNIVSTTVVNISSYSIYAMGLEYDGIWNQPSGTYRFGIRRTGAPEDAICWSDNYNRNFHVFINDGDWNEASNWNNGVVPPANSDMWILKNATIKAGDVVNVGKLHIEYTVLESLGRTFEGSLEINGSLIASMINNEKYDNLILNDGGQFRQTGLGSAINDDLNGVFNMDIDNPTEWLPHNKTGWQFISSPFQNASIAKFVSESGDGDHDLYRYDGTRTKEEWLNEKDKNGITEEEFILGRAYLASYETADNVELTGTFYQLRTFDYTQKYSFTYNPDGNLENFHLLGNPFTFDIDWANFSRRGIVDAYAVVNSEGEYEYYNSGTIKVGDGFFIKTTSSTVQFEYNDNYTATRSREQGNSINIKLHSNAGNDNVIVGFDGREEGFPKLENFNDESATICVLDNDKRYAVVNYDEDVKEVELAFEASRMGLYTIEIEADGNFDNIILLDRFTGEETDMLNGNYKFTASNQEDYNRFLIKLAKGQEPADEAKFVYQSGNELILNVKGNVQIVDVMGRIVYNEEVVNDVNRIDISTLRNSTYVVRVTNEEGTKVKKVVVY